MTDTNTFTKTTSSPTAAASTALCFEFVRGLERLGASDTAERLRMFGWISADREVLEWWHEACVLYGTSLDITDGAAGLFDAAEQVVIAATEQPDQVHQAIDVLHAKLRELDTAPVLDVEPGDEPVAFHTMTRIAELRRLLRTDGAKASQLGLDWPELEAAIWEVIDEAECANGVLR